MADLIQQNAELKAIVKRLTEALHYEQWLDTVPATHGPDCYKLGPAHYRCALKHIESLKESQ
jgi:hypothetical protein